MSTERLNTQQFFRKYTMFIAVLLIWILFGILTKGIFFRARNLSNLFRQMTITGFLASGMLLVIVTGGIDLSVGNMTGFISAVAAFIQAKVMPDILLNLMPESSILTRGIITTVSAIVVAIVVGLAVGAIQGSIIAYLGVPAFIVTLGGMLIYKGGILGVTGGKTIVPIEDTFRLIAQGYVPKTIGYIIAAIVVVLIWIGILSARKKKADYGFVMGPLYIDIVKASVGTLLVSVYTILMNQYRGIQNPVLILGVAAFIMHYITSNTRFGRYVYALGGNEEATRLSGINIKKNQFKVYMLMGLFGAFAGIILTGYVAAGTTGGGDGYELDAIASCVIGGTSLTGGSGSIIGALVGALVMASLMNGMSVMNMPIFWQFIVKGAVLIVAVYFDISSKKKKS